MICGQFKSLCCSALQSPNPYGDYQTVGSQPGVGGHQNHPRGGSKWPRALELLEVVDETWWSWKSSCPENSPVFKDLSMVWIMAEMSLLSTVFWIKPVFSLKDHDYQHVTWALGPLSTGTRGCWASKQGSLRDLNVWEMFVGKIWYMFDRFRRCVSQAPQG